MKTPVLLLLTVTLLSGCVSATVQGHLYPLQGPLATRSPVPILPMSLHTGIGIPVTVSATLDTGEVCNGVVARVAKDDPTASSMAAQWDTIYGQGFFVAHVLGSYSYGRGVLTGATGTRVSLEFYESTAEDINTAAGIAQDNRGNLYKVTF